MVRKYCQRVLDEKRNWKQDPLQNSTKPLALPHFFKSPRSEESCNYTGRQVSKALECGHDGMLWVTLAEIGN
jgi:hypothetical protein